MVDKNYLFIKFCLSIMVALFLSLAAPAWAVKRMSVNVAVANIRSGPGTSHNILWKVEKYHPLKIINTSGAWLQFVDFEGDKGWIHNSLVCNTPSVIVKQENCNIRSGPGINNKILFRSGKGVTFKVLKKKDNWIHIQHADGDKGWIHKSLVW